jgi:dTMP kinase
VSLDNAAERLERLEALLAELVEANEERPVLVEGERDVAALRALGLQGEIVRCKTAQTVFVLCEELARHHTHAILLVDWDRSGGHLARLLLEALHANSVRCDEAFRRELAALSQKEVVAVEDLPRFLDNLRLATRKHPGRRTNP